MAKKKNDKQSKEPIKKLKADFIARKLAIINMIEDEDKARKMANRVLYK